MLRQDCCLILLPYPFSLGDPSAMSLEEHGTRALSCSSSAFCALATEGPPRIKPGRVDPNDIEACLVFFSKKDNNVTDT